MAEDFPAGIISVDTFVEVAIADIITEFGSDADDNLNTASLSFGSATINGAGVFSQSEVGFRYEITNTDDGSLFFDTNAMAFDSVAAGQFADVAIAFNVSDGDTSDDGVLSFTVSGSGKITDNIVLAFVGPVTTTSELMVTAEDDGTQSNLAFSAGGVEDVSDVLVALSNSDDPQQAFTLLRRDESLLLVLAIAEGAGSTAQATVTNFSSASSFATGGGSANATANNHSTVTASAEDFLMTSESSVATAVAVDDSAASADATNSSIATAFADGQSGSTASASDDSDAQAIGVGGSAAEASASDQSGATADAEEASNATAVAIQNSTTFAGASSTASATSFGSENGTANAVASVGSLSNAVALNNSAASSTARNGSDALALAEIGSAADANAEDESSSSATADNSSVATANATIRSTSTASALDIGSSTAVATIDSVSSAESADTSIATAVSEDESASSAVAAQVSDAQTIATMRSAADSIARAGSSADAQASSESVVNSVANDSSNSLAIADTGSVSNATSDNESVAASRAVDSSTAITNSDVGSASTATASIGSDAAATGLNHSAAEAIASDQSGATADAEGSSNATATARLASTTFASAGGMSSATAFGNENGIANSVATGASISNAVAINGSAASSNAGDGSDALAFADTGSAADADAENASSSSAAAEESSVATAAALDFSTSTALAVLGSSAVATTMDQSVATVSSRDESLASAVAETGSAARAIADESGDSTATAADSNSVADVTSQDRSTGTSAAHSGAYATTLAQSRSNALSRAGNFSVAQSEATSQAGTPTDRVVAGTAIERRDAGNDNITMETTIAKAVLADVAMDSIGTIPSVIDSSSALDAAFDIVTGLSQDFDRSVAGTSAVATAAAGQVANSFARQGRSVRTRAAFSPSDGIVATSNTSRVELITGPTVSLDQDETIVLPFDFSEIAEGLNFVILSGFPSGTLLSQGTPSRNGSTWRFNAPPVGDVQLTLPPEFSGSFDVTVRTQNTPDAMAFSAQAFSVASVAPTSISISDVRLVETDSGTQQAILTVTRDNNSTNASVQFRTTEVSATAGEDFVATSGRINFQAGGSLTQTITVDIIGDTDIELNERVAVRLSGASGASIEDATGFITIVNNDEDIVDTEGRLSAQPLVVGQNVLTFVDLTPGSFSAFVLGDTEGSTTFADYGVTVDIASASVPVIAVADADGVARAVVSLTSEQLTNPLFFQAFEIAPSGPVSNLVRGRVAMDVNGDTIVTSLDALMIVNSLGRRTTSSAEGEPSSPMAFDQALDVSGDGQLTSLDALMVINSLSRSAVTLPPGAAMLPTIEVMDDREESVASEQASLYDAAMLSLF